MAMGMTNIGTLGVTLKFNDNFSAGINSAMKNLSKNMDGVGKTVTTAQKKMSSGWGQVFGQLLDFKTMVGQIVHYITFSIGVQMVRAVEQGIQQMVDIFREYEKAIVNATAVSGYMGKSFDIAREKIDAMTRELATKTIFTAKEVAKAMYSISSSGIDPLTTSVEELIPILRYAQATQADLEQTTEDLLTIIKQFQLGLEDLGWVTDTFTTLIATSFMTAEQMADAFKQVGQVAGELNQDLVDVAATLTLLRDRGYDGGQAGQRLNMIFTALLDPSDEARRTIASLGLTLSELDPTTNSVVDILKKLNKANFDAGDAATMFRARTAGAMSTLVGSVDAIEEYVVMSKQMSGITEMIAEKQMATLEGKMKSMEDLFQQFSVTVGTNVTNAMNDLASVVDYLGNSLKNLGIPQEFLDSLGKISDYLSPLTLIGKALDYFKLRVIGPQDAMDDWKEQIPKFVDAMNALNGEFSRGSNAVDDYEIAMNRVIGLRTKMSGYITEAARGTQVYRDLLLDLTSAEMDLQSAEGGVINASNELIDIYLSQNSAVAGVISQYMNYQKATSKQSQNLSNINSYTSQLVDLELELARVTSIYGADSEQANTILNEYNTTVRLLSAAKEDDITYTKEMNDTNDEYLKQLDGLTPQLRAVADSAIELIDSRGALIRAQQDYNSSLMEYNRLTDIQTNREKYLSEAFINLYDAQDKLWEIESKRYQLKEDEEKLGQDLFDALAEEGLLTDDIIQQYVEWQEAEGELLKAKAEYARGEITEEELAKYIENARKEYEDYAGVGEDVNGVAVDYAQNLIDIGAASNDVADTLYDIYDISNDEEQTMQKWEDAVAAVNNAISNIKDIELVSDNDITEAKTKVDEFLSELKTKISNLEDYKVPKFAMMDLNEIGAGYTAWFTLSEDQKNKMRSDLDIVMNIAKGKILGKFWDWFIKPPLDILTAPIKTVGEIWNSMTSGLGNIWDFILGRPTGLLNMVKDIAITIWNTISGMFPIPILPKINIPQSYNKPISGRSGRAKGGITRGAEVSLIGEAGAEAIIPLQGGNRKYGRELLQHIIPTYYPELLRMQQGGIVGGSYDYSQSQNENYTITGPVNVYGVNDVDQFGEKLRFRMRASK